MLAVVARVREDAPALAGPGHLDREGALEAQILESVHAAHSAFAEEFAHPEALGVQGRRALEAPHELGRGRGAHGALWRFELRIRLRREVVQQAQDFLAQLPILAGLSANEVRPVVGRQVQRSVEQVPGFVEQVAARFHHRHLDSRNSESLARKHDVVRRISQSEVPGRPPPDRQLAAENAMESLPEPDARGVRQRFSELYLELCRIAAVMLARWPEVDILSDDLVSEAFLRLAREESRRTMAGRSELGEKPGGVFKACFGAACRDVLWEQRRRVLMRRETPARSSLIVTGLPPIEFADLHEALSRLAEQDPMEAQIVEARVFGELTIEECAELFSISPRTVNRRWGHGMAWLAAQFT
ncbi:MAG: hypothetical protein IPM29_31080 [Planctomycetes bacterium]|nr:hypothetical protein [Planctomycetota bacterium]